jgi:AraC family transcriptional regulator of adaptative response/methylated-DNA-[protein]-cysteine methyltransferase
MIDTRQLGPEELRDVDSSVIDRDDYARIAAAIDYLRENYRTQPSLDELATHLNLSPYHLQRLFRRWAGISPKRFTQYLTVEHAKELLAASHSVLDATYESGLSSPGRLHDLFVTVEAVTPGEYKQQGAGVRIAYGYHDSPFGQCLLAVTGRGICGLFFVDGAREEVLAQLRQQWPQAELVHAQAETQPYAETVFPPAVRAGAGPERRINLLLRGTNFQIKVGEALLRIPSGSVATYGDVAQTIGKPQAARAVGQAVGANAIAYLIPCHRVIRSSGEVRDYRWGRTRKQAMLGWEAAQQEAA